MIINGEKYIIEVLTRSVNFNEYLFCINAKCINTGLFSSINNLNTILSELDIGIDDPLGEDSSWIVKKEDAFKYKKIIKTSLSSPIFFKYLEKQLDLDRELSEWEKYNLFLLIKIFTNLQIIQLELYHWVVVLYSCST